MRQMNYGAGGEADVWREPPEAPAVPEPRVGAIDVWRVRLGEAGGEWMDLLCGQERERAAGMVDVRRGRLWAQGRGVVRELLGRYLGRDPRELRFAVGERGKPALAGGTGQEAGTGAGGGLHFNLSHSGELALVAVSWGREVGVDVEQGRNPPMDPDRAITVARRGLGEEAGRRLEGLAAARREEELLRGWTAHEAAVKCAGSGIGGGGERGDGRMEAMWTAALDPGPGAFGAVAAAGAQEATVCCWEWRG